MSEADIAVAAADPGIAEEAAAERSIGRLLGLADAVFAIAMTLLALDLKIPEGIGERPTARVLLDALGNGWPSYLSFLLGFYVIANYWRRHHTLLRTVRVASPALVQRTILLLLAISAMPFACSLLGNYGSANAVPVIVFSAVNIAAVLMLLSIRQVFPRPHRSAALWFNLAAMLLAIPGALLFPERSVLVLTVLLIIGGRADSIHARLVARAA